MPDEFLDALERIMLQASDEVLALIAEALGEVTADTAYVEIVMSSKAIDAKVQAILDKARKSGSQEIERMFDKLKAEREDWAKPYFEAQGITQVDTEAKTAIIAAGVESARKTVDYLTNSKVVGIMQNGKLVTPRQAYVKAVTEAANATNIGAETFQATVQRTCRQLVQSGLRVNPKSTQAPRVQFSTKTQSGKQRTQELYSKVRTDTMAVYSETVLDYNNEIGEQFGADGWEVTAHALCAQDHLEFQGQQYTKQEMEDIQSGLARKLMYGANCHHELRPIIMDINIRAFSDKQLKEMQDYSNKMVTFRGLNGQERTMTRYNASQYLRSLENKTRQLNTQAKLEKLAGTESGAKAIERRVRSVAKQLCEDTGLLYDTDRMRSAL